MVTLLSVAGVIAAGSTAALVNAQVLDTQTARPPAVSIAGEVDLGDDATLGTATRLDPATDPVPAGSTTTPSATTIAITPITGVALDPSPSARLTEAAPPPVPPPLVADDGDDDGDDDAASYPRPAAPGPDRLFGRRVARDPLEELRRDMGAGYLRSVHAISEG